MNLPQPWLADAMERLDLRDQDRCLVLGCPTPAHVGAVSQAVGHNALIVVVEPDEELAEHTATGQHETLEVMNFEPDPDESLGSFDAILACPLTTMGWSAAHWSQLIVRNLRPGGRFVLDLPAESFCEPMRRAWSDVGGDLDELADVHGPSESTLADALRDRGLRNVEAAIGTHLVRLETPFVLANLLESIEADPACLDDFGRRLVELLQTNGEAELVLHRTQLHGIR